MKEKKKRGGVFEGRLSKKSNDNFEPTLVTYHVGATVPWVRILYMILK